MRRPTAADRRSREEVGTMTTIRKTPARSLISLWWPRVRFILSWVLAIALVAYVIPRAVNISWDGIWPMLNGLNGTAVLMLSGLWLAGLVSHTFVLVAAAPSLSHRRALTLNLTGSAVSNVVPMGGAAGMELNRRMMK